MRVFRQSWWLLLVCLLLQSAHGAAAFAQTSFDASFVDLLEGTAGSRLGDSISCTGTGFLVGAGAVGVDRGVLPSAANSAGSASLVSITGIAPSAQSLTPSNPLGGFGYSVAYLSSAAPEYAVGAPFQNSNSGAVYRFSSGLVETTIHFSPGNGETFGYSLAELDPTASPGTVIVGAPSLGATTAAGAVYLYDTGATNPTATYSGSSGGSRFGFAVASTGDYTGDGVRDVAIGAPNDGASGSVSVHPSRNSTAALYVATPAVTGLRFGISIAGEGDLTRDALGVHDLLVGAPGATSTDIGRVELHAGESIIATPRQSALMCRIKGETRGFGTSVATLGDIDSDGVPDFLVGAPDETDTTGKARGKLYLYSFTAPAAALTDRCVLKGSFVGDFDRVISQLGRTVAGGPRCDLAANGDQQFDFLAGAESVPVANRNGKVEAFFVPIATPVPTATPNAGLPSTANLSYIIKRDGEFVTALELDEAPPAAGCTAKIYGRIVADPFRTTVATINTFTVTDQTQAARARGLPTVAKIKGTVPASYLIAEVDCGAGKFYSNIFGRLVNCGSTKVVTANQWLQVLAKNFTLKVNTAALVAQYGARMRRQSTRRHDPHGGGR